MVDLLISIKKGLYVFAMGGIAAVIDYLANFGVDPTQILWVSAVLAFMRVIQDAVKHWND